MIDASKDTTDPRITNGKGESFFVATMTWSTVTEYLLQMTTGKFRFSYSFKTYYQVCNKSNTTCATCGSGTVYPSGAPEFIPVFGWVRGARSLVLCVTF